MALRLGDLSEANGGFPVVTRNWKSIRDKKIYGHNDLPGQGRKECRRVGYPRGRREMLSPVYLTLSPGPAAALAGSLSPTLLLAHS